MQRERIYSLIIGDNRDGQGFEVNELHMTFDVSKTSDNKKHGNSAIIEVFNLNDDHLALLQKDYVACSLSIGYKDEGLKALVQGNVVECRTVDRGPDTVSQIIIGEGYATLSKQTVKAMVPPNKDGKAVLEELIKQMPGIDKGAFVALPLDNPVLFGYPLNGTPKDLLNEFCRANNTEWCVTNNSLYVTNNGGLISKDKAKAILINAESGLIESPFHTSADHTKMKKDKSRKKGVQFKALANPALIPGAMVRLESERITGWYRVNSVRFNGGYESSEWYMDVFCGEILDEENKDES